MRLETTGTVVTVAGGALLIPGAILAVYGQSRMSDIDWRLERVAGFVVPTRDGLVAAAVIRF